MANWKTLNNEPIDDINAWVKAATASGQTVHIGTDSLPVGKYTEFVTVVAILTAGKGGRAAYKREKLPRMTSLRHRLLKETWYSVEFGLQITEIVAGKLTVHIDANPIAIHASSDYVKELVSLVVSNGFEAKIKPEAWAATHASDHVVRTLGR